MARFIISGAAVVTLILLAGAPGRAQQAACGGEATGNAVVASVLDGRTFLTTDRREVRLAGIEAPGGKAALETQIGGKTVTLRRTGEDRYGRVVAHAELEGASVQQHLLRAGAAYVAANVATLAGPKPCADALFAAEAEARQAKRGLWADAELGPKSAANRDEILRAKGRFAVVEGRVLSVRESGGAVYLNFGTYYTRDFSVMLLTRNAPRFAFAPKELEGKRVRVRGVVEMRRGPFIEAARPEQIELIE